MDSVLYEGDRLFSKIRVCQESNLSHELYQYLNFDEVRVIFCTFNKKRFHALAHVFDHNSFEGESFIWEGPVHQTASINNNLQDCVTAALQHNPDIVLVIAEYSVGIHRFLNGCFIFFDSHARSSAGMPQKMEGL